VVVVPAENFFATVFAFLQCVEPSRTLWTSRGLGSGKGSLWSFSNSLSGFFLITRFVLIPLASFSSFSFLAASFAVSNASFFANLSFFFYSSTNFFGAVIVASVAFISFIVDSCSVIGFVGFVPNRSILPFVFSSFEKKFYRVHDLAIPLTCR
jgi:hypothetical protein